MEYKKIILGIGSIIPTIYVVVIASVHAFVLIPTSGEFMGEFVGTGYWNDIKVWLYFHVVFLSMVLFFGICYSVHSLSSTRRFGNHFSKFIWLIALIVAGAITIPIYWYLHIWRPTIEPNQASPSPPNTIQKYNRAFILVVLLLVCIAWVATDRFTFTDYDIPIIINILFVASTLVLSIHWYYKFWLPTQNDDRHIGVTFFRNVGFISLVLLPLIFVGFNIGLWKASEAPCYAPDNNGLGITYFVNSLIFITFIYYLLLLFTIVVRGAIYVYEGKYLKYLITVAVSIVVLSSFLSLIFTNFFLAIPCT